MRKERKSSFERMHVLLPSPCHDIERVTSMVALGVVISESLTATDRVSSLLELCSRLLYALCILRDHGSTVIAKLLYCMPAWAGFCSAADPERLDAFLCRCKKL